MIFDEKDAYNILIELDSWELDNTTSSKNNTNDESSDCEGIDELRVNKKINFKEVEYFFFNCFNEALLISKRENLNDLQPFFRKIFLLGVYKLTASRLWQKYNIRVTNENLEDVYIESYGGKLQREAMKILKKFTINETRGLKKKRNINTSFFLKN